MWWKRYGSYFFGAILLVLAAFFCFHNLGHLPLAQWDERTNVRVVRAPLGYGHPLDLMLGGKPFFEKTPLWYYSTEATVLLLGDGNWQLRLVSALAGFLLILGVAHAGWRLWGAGAGLLAGAMLLATPHLWVRNVTGYFSTHTLRSADVDPLFLLFLLLSWAATVKFVRQGNNHWLSLAAFAAGLAVMTKGPIGLLSLIVFGVWGVMTRRDAMSPFAQVTEDKNRVPTLLMPATAAFLLTVLPWYLWMYVRYGWTFIDQHFGYHLLQRIGVTLENHSEHWWFYLKLLSDPQVFPCALWLVLALGAALSSKKWKQDYVTFSLTTLVISLIVLMTLAQTRIAWYILPVYPFAALLTAGRVVRQKPLVQADYWGTIVIGMVVSFIQIAG
ncbi:hypothetical protein AUK40_05110 [Candidatus Wirthbacteria bacterium CG2_30_54_11]|uniref:Glycosyltransferase RgtA/B/C/D-like domain-containing protein n=1 Tax=Candidatus Wirthbacteria bacterium CG2_30_54_11 TaxID=1817892 RepID=A0A1J5IYN5_9BACT|nr:MAG: hypothetical protein AUK40_05110 [Candidatus Wirthbacteria bacterium CG2_30_54_11]